MPLNDAPPREGVPEVETANVRSAAASTAKNESKSARPNFRAKGRARRTAAAEKGLSATFSAENSESAPRGRRTGPQLSPVAADESFPKATKLFRARPNSGLPPVTNVPATRSNMPGPRARARALLMFTLRRAATWVSLRPPAVVTPVPPLKRRLESHEGVTAILSLILSGTTVLLTAKGAAIPMSETGGGAIDRAEALVFAIGVGTASFLGYLWGFGVVTRLTGKRLAAGAAITATYLSAIAAIDAPFNMLALAGGSAVQMSLIETTACYETRPAPVTANATAVRRVLPFLAGQAAQFDDWAKKEVKGGHTGAAGEGKLSATASRLATQLKRLHDDLSAGLVRVEAIGAGITGELAAIKKQAFTDGPIRARAQAVSTGGDRIDELLGQMKQFDFSSSVQAAIISLEESVVVPPKAATPFEAKQNAQLAELAVMAKTAARALSTFPSEANSSGSMVEACPRPANAMDAIKTYWKPLLPQWLAALFLSLSQALLIALALVVRREPDLHEGGKR